MDQHSLQLLEFEKVLGLVARNTHWEPGREAVLSLRPGSPDQIRRFQAEVAEAARLVDESRQIVPEGLSDVREALQGASRDRTLRPEELLGVAELARASRRIGRLLREAAERAPNLAERACRLPAFPRIEQEIERCLGVDGQVLDAASARLRHLRAEIAQTQGRIQEALQRVLRQPAYAKMLQESLVSVRQGRYVVPVRSECRGQFPGLVIDQSASGATVFMEPWPVVEQGNKLRSLQVAEAREVEAVLHRLSGLVGHESEALLAAAAELAHLDCLLAAVAFARDFGATLPRLNEQGVLRLEQARHPLLLIQPELKVVPITVEVGAEARTLILTGPNTGGKTVTLKTIGLLCLLGLCGLPIPAEEGSTIPYLTGVFADIGDEQSIAQNLSTFSSHLTQILRILPQAGEQTLVLLDELGAGTDPVEGGALGMALLEYLHARGARTVVTTHLSELKVFASRTEGMSNAAMEFDPETLQPTYRVLMGVPGRSNALQIAARLGLPEEVLRRARGHLGRQHVRVEGLLDQLEQERAAAQAVGLRLRGEEDAVRRLRQQYEERLRGAQEESRRLLEEAARQAEELVSSTRQRVHGMLRDFRARIGALARLRREELEKARALAGELARALAQGLEPESLDSLSGPALELLRQALEDIAARRPAPPPRLEEAPGVEAAAGEPSGPEAAGVEAAAGEPSGPEAAGVEAAAGEPSGPEAPRVEAAAGEPSGPEAPRVEAAAGEPSGPEAPRVEAAAGEPSGPEASGVEAAAGEPSGQEAPGQEVPGLAQEEPLPMVSETVLPEAAEGDELELEGRVAARVVEAELEQIVRRAAPLRPSRAPRKQPALRVGETVYLRRYGQEGTVLSAGDSKVEVQVGVVRLTVGRDEVEPLSVEPRAEPVRLPVSERATVSPRVDLRGLTVDEALFELDQRLDEASLAGLDKIEVIHGKGTGALRKAVSAHLKGHSMVDGFRLGEMHEGGSGVTVVRLK
jgi:DNA mismatch repair protein MutS2